MKNYKIKKILVPFDFTNGALNALKVADKFALEFNAKVHLLNITEPYVTMHPLGLGPGYPSDMEQYTKTSTQAINRYLENNSLYPETYTYSMQFGFYYSTIVEQHKKENYDLVILPVERYNFFDKLNSKYNVLKIMQLTGIPVISVNKYHRIIDFRNIVLPIRNIINWYEKIPFMVSLAKRTGGSIHAVGLRESNKESKIQFDYILDEAISILEKENILSSVTKFEGANSLYELKLFSRVQKADLIAVTPPLKIKPVISIVKPSLYARLLSDSPTPLFGVKPS